ncbi:MAG: cysteine--tRNA ligase [Candidatus Omnitrophota bacterium]|jgi:cysteinyl-tRNA synthetase
MKIYNTLTRSKEEFIPLNGNEVNMYTCGVTVYDSCHIGHARSLYVFDIIRRYLEYKGYKVNFVRNITDIDDKIISRSVELGVNWRSLVEKYIASYNQDLASMGIRRGMLDADSEEPRATKNIPDIVEYIKTLIAKGYAYQSGGDVYFEVKKAEGYGKLSRQNTQNMRDGVRIEPGEKKRDSLDFALWKDSKEGEPSWPSPWGNGRPGWHIECSVMSQKFLNTHTLDIHAGGGDLVFPHHENEIAQSEACTGRPFAKYWIHHGLLTIEGRKMSKSLGNFITIQDVLRRYSPDLIRLLFLQAHYSSPVDFSDEKIRQVGAALERFGVFFAKADNEPEDAVKETLDDAVRSDIDALKDGFIAAMDDDFNSPQALGKLFEIMTLSNSQSVRGRRCLAYAASAIRELAAIFNLAFKDSPRIAAGLEAYVEAMIERRNACRVKGDFRTADAIRDELRVKGIIIEDSKGATSWRRQ